MRVDVVFLRAPAVVGACAVYLVATAAGVVGAQTSRDAATHTDAAVDIAMRCTPVDSHDEGDDDDAPDATRPTDATARDDAGDASPRCAPPRAVIDRAEHCCLPGQTWRANACAGTPTSCPPGESHDESGGCSRRPPPAADGGAPSARVYEAPSATVPPGMVLVPGALFRSGGQWVSVGPFALDRTEVTAAAWARCVTAGVCAAAPDPFGQTRDTATAPMVNVTWAMASRYCGWAGGRLPTEAEWELAARGLDGRRYPWGERAPDCSLARHAGCRDAPLRVGALPAGASAYGLVDMAGNVAEWTADRFGPRASAGAGTGVRVDPTGATTGTTRVVRGGSFVSVAAELTTEARRAVDEREARAELGFRCARGL